MSRAITQEALNTRLRALRQTLAVAHSRITGVLIDIESAHSGEEFFLDMPDLFHLEEAARRAEHLADLLQDDVAEHMRKYFDQVD